MTLRDSILCLVLASTVAVCAQSDAVEVACDTVILQQHYTVKRTEPGSGVTSFGNYDRKGRKHGWWCKPLMRDFLVEACRYRHGRPTGTCYDNGRVTEHGRSGRILRQYRAIPVPPF
jgi:hypothetical protein